MEIDFRLLKSFTFTEKLFLQISLSTSKNIPNTPKLL